MLPIIAAVLPSVAKGAESAISRLGSGGTSADNTATRCPGQPSDEAVAYMLQNAPQKEIDRLKKTFADAKLSGAFTTPYRIAYEAFGGNHCNWDADAKSKAIYNQFVMMMMQYGPPNGLAPAPTSPAAASNGNVSLGDELRKIGGNVVATATQIARSTVTGALAGADSATTGAASGAQVGTFATTNAIPIFLIGAGVVLVLLIRKA